jgi:hypothetical protein
MVGGGVGVGGDRVLDFGGFRGLVGWEERGLLKVEGGIAESEG